MTSAMKNTEPLFIPEQLYHRRREIHARFGGQEQGGMITTGAQVGRLRSNRGACGRKPVFASGLAAWLDHIMSGDGPGTTVPLTLASRFGIRRFSLSESRASRKRVRMH
jgi:hypothetical protein